MKISDFYYLQTKNTVLKQQRHLWDNNLSGLQKLFITIGNRLKQLKKKGFENVKLKNIVLNTP